MAEDKIMIWTFESQNPKPKKTLSNKPFCCLWCDILAIKAISGCSNLQNWL